MGTRSTVKFYDGGQEPILSVYQQYDGYISGVGHKLAKFLAGKTVINGYNTTQTDKEFANGMGCLAAQYVKEHKRGIGGFYITNKEDEQEYNYKVSQNGSGFIIEVYDGEQLFIGSPEELLKQAELQNS